MNASQRITCGLFGLMFASSAQAQPTPAEAPITASTSTVTMVNGEVRKVDRDAGKLTLRHEPLTHLGMEAMTMVFRVGDPTMLDQVKAGDKVRFVADKVNGQFTVLQIEAAK